MSFRSVKIISNKLAIINYARKLPYSTENGNKLGDFQDLLLTTPRKAVAHVQLNRPQKRNALSNRLWREIGNVFRHLNDDQSCRAIVLSGRGQSFCAGIDLVENFANVQQLVQQNNGDAARKGRALRAIVQKFQEDFSAVDKCSKPVIASVHGHAVGGATSLLSCCDIRYSASDALYSIKEVNLGLAADVGVLNRIGRIVSNDSLTRELAFTGRVFNAQEALDYGFVSRLFPSAEACLEASLSIAETIAQNSPIAVQGTKLALNYSRDHSIEDSLNFILTWNQSQLQTEDILKSAMAAMSKSSEKPKFDDV